MKHNKIIRKIFAAIIMIMSIFIIFGLFIFFVLSGGFPHHYYKNNNNLSKLAKQFQNIPLPSKSTAGRTYKKFGCLTGNGEHGQYFIARIINTNLSEKQLQDFYKNKSIKPVGEKKIYGSKYKNEVSLNIVKVDDLKSNSSRIPKYLLNKILVLKPEISNDIPTKNKNYLLFIFDEFYPASDFRCFH